MAESSRGNFFDLEEISSEIAVLKSIYGEEFRPRLPKDVHPYAQDQNLISLIYIDITEQITLLFLLKEDYPSSPPNIEVETKEDSDLTALEQYLQERAIDFIGSSMLFNLVEIAKEWLDEYHISPSTNPKIQEVHLKSGTMCKFFLKGKCTFGERCRNVHLDPSNGPKTRAMALTHSPLSKPEKLDQKSNEPSPDKKPPMRTATDIIKRLCWDNNLDKTEFTIGYLDRFTGIIEQPFGDFSWEDIASVDDTTTLAIPKHRIQYFKFKNEMVWDKRCRLDDFFGSTGSGKTILDVMNHMEANCYKEEHIEEEKDLDDTEDENHSNQSQENLFSRLGSFDRAFKITNRPNYFVAIQINDPGILTSVKRIQESVKVHQPDLAPFCISLLKLHLTLCTLRIDNQQDLEKSIKSFLKFKEKLIQLSYSQCVLKFKGLQNFDRRVLYSPPSHNPIFTQITSDLNSLFTQDGIKLLGNKVEFTPHLTLVKIPKHKSKTLSLSEVNTDMYSELVDGLLGTQAVETLQLCAMTGLGDDGGYPIQSSINLFQNSY